MSCTAWLDWVISVLPVALPFTSSHSRQYQPVAKEDSTWSAMPVDFSTLMSASPRHESAFYPLRLQSFDPDLSPGGPFSSTPKSPCPPPPFSLRSLPLHISASPSHSPRTSRAQSEMDLVLTDPILIHSSASLPEVSASAPSGFSLLSLGLPSLHNNSSSLSSTTSQGMDDFILPSKPKKTVVFADECGGMLVEIRMMSEPSDVPPKLSESLLRALLGEAACEEARPCATWHLNFSQPASEYLRFRTAVNTQNLALENVILRNEECTLSGTIKVKNLCFRKEVFVRITEDGWATHRDEEAHYVPGSPGQGASSSTALDTFSFCFQIPCDDERRRRLEFAVCFREVDSGQEHWDNNGGANFVILSQKAGLPKPQPSTTTAFKPSADAFQINHHNWASFSVLHDLKDSHPYY